MFEKKGKWIADLGNGRYKNPILFTDYSDPDVIRVGDDYFMTASSFTYFPGLPVLHSKDLVNWRIISYAIDSLPFECYDMPQHGKGVWAPSIRYHNGTFYIYFATPDEGIFVVTSKDPFGKWEKVRLVKSSKGWIDPCPFWDDDGKAYLVRGVARSRIGYKSKLFLHKMSEDGMSLLDDGVLVFDGRINHPTVEGPKMYKRNGYYYIFAPAGGVQTGWQLEARSKNIYGPYEHRVVLSTGNSGINGPHQGGLVETDEGAWFIHFRDMAAYGRVTYLQPAKWINDWCEMGTGVHKGRNGEPYAEYEKPVNGYDKIEPMENEFFKKGRLSLNWQWQAHEPKDAYELTGNALRLYCLPVDGANLSSAPQVLSQLIKRPNFISTVKVRPNLGEDEEFGLLITGGTYLGIKVKKHGNGFIISNISFELEKDTDEKNTKETVLAEAAVDKCTDIYLRLEMRFPGLVSVSYSTDGGKFFPLGEEKLFKVSRKSWVGGRVGIYASGSQKGYADFEYMDFE